MRIVGRQTLGLKVTMYDKCSNPMGNDSSSREQSLTSLTTAFDPVPLKATADHTLTSSKGISSLRDFMTGAANRLTGRAAPLQSRIDAEETAGRSIVSGEVSAETDWVGFCPADLRLSSGKFDSCRSRKSAFKA